MYQLILFIIMCIALHFQKKVWNLPRNEKRRTIHMVLVMTIVMCGMFLFLSIATSGNMLIKLIEYSILYGIFYLLTNKRVRQRFTSLRTTDSPNYNALCYAGMITIIVCLVVLMGMMLADGMGAPIQYAMGGTQQEVEAASLFGKASRHPGAVIGGVIATFGVSYLLWRALHTESN